MNGERWALNVFIYSKTKEKMKKKNAIARMHIWRIRENVLFNVSLNSHLQFTNIWNDYAKCISKGMKAKSSSTSNCATTITTGALLLLFLLLLHHTQLNENAIASKPTTIYSSKRNRRPKTRMSSRRTYGPAYFHTHFISNDTNETAWMLNVRCIYIFTIFSLLLLFFNIG